MITDQIGRQKVLLPINHNINKICVILGSFFKSKHKKFRDLFLLAVKKKPFERMHMMARTVQLLRNDTYSPITLSY